MTAIVSANALAEAGGNRKRATLGRPGTSTPMTTAKVLTSARATTSGRVWFAGLVLMGALQAQPLQLRPGVPLTSGATPLDVGDYAIPCVTDWNGDGRKDLLVGYRYADKLALFLNTGNDAAPAFAGYVNLQANGTDIWVPGAGCGAPAPWVCDFDHDGNRDLLVGSGGDGTVAFFRNLGTNGAPVLARGTPLTLLNGDPVKITSLRATPYVHDWDEDGLADVLCGAGDGTVFFFRNITTPASPLFLPGVQLQAGGSTLNLGARSVVRVCDWDGDGRKDVLGSSSTGVYWCRNTGSNPAPVLAAPVPLRVPNTSGSLVAIRTSDRMRLDLCDWNNDGVVDLLLGNTDGTVAFYESYVFAVTSFTVRTNAQVILRWNSAPYVRYGILTGPKPDAVRDAVAAGLASGGRTTSWTNYFLTRMQFFQVQFGP
jgi:hypothetical protein